MKIVRLTERDLKQIVEKVLNEQRAIPTAQRGQRNDDVKQIQRALKTKGYNLGSGGPKNDGVDGIFGAATQRAVRDFQTKMKLSPTGRVDQTTRNSLFSGFANTQFLNTLPGKTDIAKKSTNPAGAVKSSTTGAKTPKPKAASSIKSVVTQTKNEPGLFDKAVEFCTSPFKRLKDLVNSIDLASISPLPPHLRAFMSFLIGREEPIKASFFKPAELKVISDRVNSFFPKNSTCKRNKKCYVSFYDDTNWSNVKSGTEKVVNPELAKAIGFTIGNGQVIDNGNSYIVKDIYDFNNFKNNPEAYSPEKAGETVKAALKKISCGNYIQGIEELASFKQSQGYKGIPVEIEIPKTS
jgi:peptidoglycan hydrolase-like protein with peptidoglycan-binding domain